MSNPDIKIHKLRDELEKFARSREELPPLKEGHARIVHITHESQVQAIISSGYLDYSRHGMLMSIARTYSNADVAEYSSDDSRFSGPGMVALVVDVPIEGLRIHEKVGQAPGRLPIKGYVVGVVES